MAHWNPMLVLKSCGFSPEEIQTQLQAVRYTLRG